MGTDVYLLWDGMTKKDKEKQRWANLNCGHCGYLRASVGMYLENQVLSLIFPKKYWESRFEPVRYEFNMIGYREVLKIGAAYLTAKIFGSNSIEPICKEFGVIVPSDFEIVDNNFRIGMSIVNTLKRLGFEVDTSSSLSPFRETIMWLNSLFSFYELGMEKEEEKKNPKVYISW